jgi:hypothetical protein
MKKITVLIFCGLLTILTASAQSDRDYIAQKIRINYIPHPNTAPLEIIRIPVSRVTATTGFVFGTTSENGMDQCALFLKQLLQPVASGSNGQPLLQQIIAGTMRITGDSIVMNIYNDVAAFNNYAKTQYFGDTSVGDHVWPNAHRGDVDPSATGADHTGYIDVGEDYASGYGITEMRRTIVHEMMHTQDFSDVRYHMWGRFRYGTDGDHYGFELIPNITDAFGEGIANSMVYLYSDISRRQVEQWFGNNDWCVIESTTPRLRTVAPSDWLYTQVSSTNPPGAGGAPASARLRSLGYKSYHLAQIPARWLLHNEQIMGMIGAEYARRVGKAKYIQAIRSGNGQMFRVSTSPHARWFEALSSAAIPDGLTMSSIRASSRAEMPYLFALALADYFTYYRANSAAEFRSMFENSLAEDWVDLYWTAGKEIVRRAAPITMTNGNPPVLNVNAQIDLIARALGVRTP